jgi:hypothetical protein
MALVPAIAAICMSPSSDEYETMRAPRDAHFVAKSSEFMCTAGVTPSIPPHPHIEADQCSTFFTFDARGVVPRTVTNYLWLDTRQTCVGWRARPSDGPALPALPKRSTSHWAQSTLHLLPAHSTESRPKCTHHNSKRKLINRCECCIHALRASDIQFLHSFGLPPHAFRFAPQS